ncbi:FMN reductase [Glaciihabitans tibetensis]|uniref:FMN reductase n=1 Tax=Glaciihabitans tibetensis TaxID=1266600 RepID=A0A2T0VCG2_9MICO|nr:NAD(P)H-dependent oxidoreductase [Glaciihabitans tibetensis]PRY67860.1 FMN reductase [Glaciihabitans tibetensis]
MLKVTLLVGNPKADSRTLRIAKTLVVKLLAEDSYTLTVIDLANYSSTIFTWPSAEMNELTQAAADSDLLVVASPTYKATYTGLLKAFLDRYSNKGLRGVIAIPVMTGADLSHSMGPDVHLRPLLVELGASVPTSGLYFVASQMDHLDEIADAWAREASEVLNLLLPLIHGAAAYTDGTEPALEPAGAHR